MNAAKRIIAPQQLEQAHRALNGELCKAFEPLTDMLDFSFIAPRAYAELREAKAVLTHLKYADAAQPVAAEDIGWALKAVVESYLADGETEAASVLSRAARMLGIDLSKPHPIPADLNRKIQNELRLSGEAGEPAVQAPLVAA